MTNTIARAVAEAVDDGFVTDVPPFSHGMIGSPQLHSDCRQWEALRTEQCLAEEALTDQLLAGEIDEETFKRKRDEIDEIAGRVVVAEAKFAHRFATERRMFAAARPRLTQLRRLPCRRARSSRRARVTARRAATKAATADPDGEPPRTPASPSSRRSP